MHTPSNPSEIALVLRDLIEGDIPGIYPGGGQSLADACMVCLHSHSHEHLVQLAIVGTTEYVCSIHWEPELVTERMCHFWKDMDRAAEWGAEGIAILLVLAVTDYTVIDRSVKGTGFDYWLGHKGSQDMFTYAGRLEVSGMRKGTDGELNRRTQRKVEQTKQSDALSLPAFAIVVEFSRPKAKMIRR
jgi:hypothetical protein